MCLIARISPSPKSHVCTDLLAPLPHPLFGAVPQTCLWRCLRAAALILPQLKLDLQLSGPFSVDAFPSIKSTVFFPTWTGFCVLKLEAYDLRIKPHIMQIVWFLCNLNDFVL